MSSLFGALHTAVSGLSAQSTAFGNISDNVANSQTVGYKRTDTNFTDYLTTSTAVTNDSGFVAATPDYRNDVQGTIASSDNATALAISGNGFFQVTSASTNTTNQEVLGTTTQYTRDGNFTMDKNGYLVNDAGEAVNGWAADSSGVVNQTTMAPLKVDQSAFQPKATSSVTLSANLPATPSTTDAQSSQVNVYDAQGTLHTLALSWTPDTTASNTWNLSVSEDGSTTPIGTSTVTFNDGSVAGQPAGTIESVTPDSGGLTTGGTGSAAVLNVPLAGGGQSIALNLGTFNKSDGLTQFAGTAYTLNSATQDGIPPGAFSGISTQSNGNIVANYDNGQSRTIGQVPIVQFANPDALQKQDGQVYTATAQSGPATIKTAGSNGAGNLVTSATEGSNVDIASEFTKLIVAQRAYSANTKMITTADDMLQQTIDMKR
ncbi:flagellar hook protein FlgE [Acidisphaera sp. L21]|uniref:flagellar hook protein FlgE n=1 Tax=Acidisphaera sp. L21 TaxID=1641851 RepID=UPI00131E1321|nr:flagellar hook protein FlgE [Acidisphaera sp. L21]